MAGARRHARRGPARPLPPISIPCIGATGRQASPSKPLRPISRPCSPQNHRVVPGPPLAMLNVPAAGFLREGGEWQRPKHALIRFRRRLGARTGTA
ncbi:MAG: hypothetical protein AVDCRST_MAG64-128 [uncultured Phycisphaerae bacterium]|uniref:Uncharacterized protein n=1 Tax=uncultured Phycisphaerae bacterium TaxID=904963 RepID=A0A6J4MZN8_9BACT|nr:MAG: hypothetical protein AVDCRST_MAG64-128 [uncultured Phycisphaerae bacterium]